MREFARHRYALALPFLLLALVTVAGGLLNGVNARGRLIDDFTGEPVTRGLIKHGARQFDAEPDGSYAVDGVPRTNRLRVEAQGYLITSAPPQGGDVRLTPLSITVQVNALGDPPQGISGAQIRQDTRVLGTVNPSGNTVITPHPGRDVKLLVCAKDFASQEVTARGVAMTIDLISQPGADCPPLPSPSPSPSPAPSPASTAAPGSPSPTPTASPR